MQIKYPDSDIPEIRISEEKPAFGEEHEDSTVIHHSSDGRAGSYWMRGIV